MAVTEILEDVLIHPERHSDGERELTLEVALYQLRRPMSAEEAAGVLEVSKPTILSWARAGLLPTVSESSPRRLLLDPAAIFAAKRILQSARLTGSPAQRVLRLADLAESIYWATHPRELDDVERSFSEAGDGGFVEVEDDLIERARARRRSPTSPRP